MRKTFTRLTCAAAAALSLAITIDTASAACTKLGFSVNDYGKDGPTKDAKSLLDKYIAKWAAEHNIPKYTTGKKDVSCELFLNFILFDEHTCKAEATVCWDGAPVKAGETAAAGDAAAPAEKKAAKAATGDAAAPAAEKKAVTKAAAAKPAKTEAAAPVETGSTAAAPAKEAKKEAAPAAAEKPAEAATEHAAKPAEAPAAAQ